MSPFDFNDNGEIDEEDYFLLNGPLGAMAFGYVLRKQEKPRQQRNHMN